MATFSAPNPAQGAVLLRPVAGFCPKSSRQSAKDWGVVSEIVEDGNAVNRAREIADLFLSKPAVTLRNTRAHFSQPLKEKIVREVSFGLTLETQAMAEVMMMQQSESK